MRVKSTRITESAKKQLEKRQAGKHGGSHQTEQHPNSPTDTENNEEALKKEDDPMMASEEQTVASHDLDEAYDSEGRRKELITTTFIYDYQDLVPPLHHEATRGIKASLYGPRQVKPASNDDTLTPVCLAQYDINTKIIIDYTIRVLDATGVSNGPAHCEVMLTFPDFEDSSNTYPTPVPKLIELNARPQGDMPRSTPVVATDQFTIAVHLFAFGPAIKQTGKTTQFWPPAGFTARYGFDSLYSERQNAIKIKPTIISPQLVPPFSTPPYVPLLSPGKLQSKRSVVDVVSWDSLVGKDPHSVLLGTESIDNAEVAKQLAVFRKRQKASGSMSPFMLLPFDEYQFHLYCQKHYKSVSHHHHHQPDLATSNVSSIRLGCYRNGAVYDPTRANIFSGKAPMVLSQSHPTHSTLTPSAAISMGAIVNATLGGAVASRPEDPLNNALGSAGTTFKDGLLSPWRHSRPPLATSPSGASISDSMGSPTLTTPTEEFIMRVVFLYSSDKSVFSEYARRYIRDQLPGFVRFTRGISLQQGPEAGYLGQTEKTIDIFSCPAAVILYGPRSVVELSNDLLRCLEEANPSVDTATWGMLPLLNNKGTDKSWNTQLQTATERSLHLHHFFGSLATDGIVRQLIATDICQLAKQIESVSPDADPQTLSYLLSSDNVSLFSKVLPNSMIEAFPELSLNLRAGMSREEALEEINRLSASLIKASGTEEIPEDDSRRADIERVWDSATLLGIVSGSLDPSGAKRRAAATAAFFLTKTTLPQILPTAMLNVSFMNKFTRHRQAFETLGQVLPILSGTAEPSQLPSATATVYEYLLNPLYLPSFEDVQLSGKIFSLERIPIVFCKSGMQQKFPRSSSVISVALKIANGSKSSLDTSLAKVSEDVRHLLCQLDDDSPSLTDDINSTHDHEQNPREPDELYPLVARLTHYEKTQLQGSGQLVFSLNRPPIRSKQKCALSLLVNGIVAADSRKAGDYEDYIIGNIITSSRFPDEAMTLRYLVAKVKAQVEGIKYEELVILTACPIFTAREKYLSVLSTAIAACRNLLFDFASAPICLNDVRRRLKMVAENLRNIADAYSSNLQQDSSDEHVTAKPSPFTTTDTLVVRYSQMEFAIDNYMKIFQQGNFFQSMREVGVLLSNTIDSTNEYLNALKKAFDILGLGAGDDDDADIAMSKVLTSKQKADNGLAQLTERVQEFTKGISHFAKFGEEVGRYCAYSHTGNKLSIPLKRHEELVRWELFKNKEARRLEKKNEKILTQKFETFVSEFLAPRTNTNEAPEQLEERKQRYEYSAMGALKTDQKMNCTSMCSLDMQLLRAFSKLPTLLTGKDDDNPHLNAATSAAYTTRRTEQLGTDFLSTLQYQSQLLKQTAQELPYMDLFYQSYSQTRSVELDLAKIQDASNDDPEQNFSDDDQFDIEDDMDASGDSFYSVESYSSNADDDTNAVSATTTKPQTLSTNLVPTKNPAQNYSAIDELTMILNDNAGTIPPPLYMRMSVFTALREMRVVVSLLIPDDR